MRTRILERGPSIVVGIFAACCALLGSAILIALLGASFDQPPWTHVIRARLDMPLHNAIRHTIALGAISCAFQIAIVSGLTLFVQRIPPILKVFLLAPYATGVAAPSLSVYVLLSSALGPFSAGMLGDPVGASLAVVLVDTWQWVGILLLVAIVRLERVPSSLFDQAQLEAMPRWTRWRLIVWPSVRYVMWLYAFVRAIDWLKKVDSVKAICGAGGPGYACETVGLYVSSLFYRAGSDPGYAAFLTLLQLALLGGALSVLLRHRDFYLLTGDD